MILWSKVMLALIQGLGGIYFENKNHGNSLMLKHHQCHIYMRVVSMVPHSYLVHFELVQTYCLSSYAMHIPYFDHTRTRHQSLSIMINHTKARHPPETKRKQVKWVIMLMDPCSKKKKGEDDKSKSIDDGQVLLFTRAHDQSIWMALLLRDTLFELAK